MTFNPVYTEDEPSLEQIERLAGIAVLEFGAPWCEICQAAKPIIEQALNENAGLEHIKVFDGKGKRLGRAFKVKLWPTLIALQNGQEVARVVRPTQANELQQLLAALK